MFTKIGLKNKTNRIVGKLGAPAEGLQVVGLAEAGLVVQGLELLERVFPGCKRRTLLYENQKTRFDKKKRGVIRHTALLPGRP